MIVRKNMDLGDMPVDHKIDQKSNAESDPINDFPNENENLEKNENGHSIHSINSIDLSNTEESDKCEKLRSTVCLDREVLEKAKRYNIKVSRVCNTFLRTFLDYYERVAITIQGQSQGKKMDQQVIMRKLLLDLFV